MPLPITFLLQAIPGAAILFGLAAAATWMHDHPNRWPFTLAASTFILLTGYLLISWPRHVARERLPQAG